MKNLSLTTLIIFFLSFWAYDLAGQKYFVHGMVYDQSSGEILIGANIFVPHQSTGTSTNEHGFFSLSLESADTVDVHISYVGYETLVKKVIFPGGEMDFKLAPANFTSVVVTASKSQPVDFGQVNIPVKKLKQIPNLLGEPDVMKALSFLPGVSTGLEGTSGLFVRGGTPDQNLILLDGATVYNPSHLFGFLSVFNPEAINNVQLIKGPFPAKYGGRLSSILNISMKEGNNQQHRSKFSIGLLNSSLLMEGPIKKGKSSYMVSGRSAYLGLLASPLSIRYKNKKSNYFSNYLMYDLNAKANFKLKNNGRLFLSGYLGNDDFSVKFRETNQEVADYLKWGNATFSLRYNKTLGRNLFANVLVNYNQFNFINSQESRYEDSGVSDLFSNTDRVKEVAVKTQFDWQPASAHFLKFGFEGVSHFFEPVNIELLKKGESPAGYPSIQKFKANSLAIYAEDEIKLKKHFQLNLGLRASGYQTPKQFIVNLEPRASLSFKNGPLSAQVAYSKMVQPIHALAIFSGNSSSAGLPNDIWVPATDKIAPQTAHQFSAGLAFKPARLKLSLEGFYKTMQNQISFRQGTSFFSDAQNGWEDLVEKNGLGRAIGLEFSADYEFSKGHVLMAYTLSKNTRKFDNINNGTWYPHRYDRRHDLSITGHYKLNKKWALNANLVYSSGRPVSIPDFIALDVHGYPQEVFLTRNNGRMPCYKRLDIAFSRSFTTKKDRKGQLTFSLYNVTFQKNPIQIKYFSLPIEDGLPDSKPIGYTPKANGLSILPFFPSISYSINLK